MAVTVSLHHNCYPQICSNKEHTEIPSLPDRFTHHRCSVSPFIAENWMVKIRGFSLFLSAWVLNKWGIRVLKEGSTSPLSSSFLFITWFLLLSFEVVTLRNPDASIFLIRAAIPNSSTGSSWLGSASPNSNPGHSCTQGVGADTLAS